jgi:hypothetical protein
MLEQLIRRLELLQLEIASEAMKQPAKDPFDHGLQVGRYAGLELAKAELRSLLEEADRRERDL